MSTLRAPVGAPFARLYSVAGTRGNRVVTNEEMCTLIDSSDEWIRQRTGIIERRWVDEDQTALSLATDASRTAIERSGVDPSVIDAVVVCTLSNGRQVPSLASVLADELGLAHPAGMDISAACAGFCYGVALADAMVRSGQAHYVLVVGVEVLTEITNFADRSTAFLFSDGAGAAVIGPSDTPAIGPAVWGTRGEDRDVIFTDYWRDALETGVHPVVHMEGQKVFKWAITEIAEKCVEAVEAAGLTPADLDAFIPHQANERIIDAMLRQLKLPESVAVSRDIRYMGNSSAASIPLAMDAMLQSGEAQSGDTALTIGFGAGLVYGGQVLILP